ncbi:MAG: high potential iron-sulfur protein [Proteobacteria bacterium]|nr:high potential iron-sulfur protein [Pseudomonadota bacterium]
MDNRRRSILIAAPALALGLMATRNASAQAKVTEADPTATALGYKVDASKVDTAKFKQFVKGSTCANCNFYKSTSAAEGTCAALGARLVASKGWCSAWVKKA